MMRADLIREMIEIKDEINRKKPQRMQFFDEMEEIDKKLEELSKKIDGLTNSINTKKISDTLEYSPVKTKRKDEVIQIVSQKNMVTSSQLSMIMKMSRTRCNEYLKELEKEGLVKGRVIERKMYYKYVKG